VVITFTDLEKINLRLVFPNYEVLRHGGFRNNDKEIELGIHNKIIHISKIDIVNQTFQVTSLCFFLFLFPSFTIK